MEVLSSKNTEVNVIEAEFKLNAEEFEAGVQTAYLKARNKISIPGFRVGKAPRKMIEKQYGESTFYEDAVNNLYKKAVNDVIDELNIEVVDTPDVEVESINKEEGVQFKVKFTVKPEVTIGKYLGIEIKEFDKNVTDEDVDKKLKEIQNRNARLVEVHDRAVIEGDTVTFDFKGFCDDVAFEGGSAENFTLEIGSGRFIPGFESQMVGKEIGQDFDVNVTFPSDYNEESLAGKEAVFKCRINIIQGKEFEELDDDFAQDCSEFDTLEEFKSDLRTKIAEEKEKESEDYISKVIADELVKITSGEVPEAMFERRIDNMVTEWDFKNRANGLDVESYLKFSNMTMEQFRNIFKEPAEKQVKLRLALERIAELENITISEEEIDSEYKELAKIHKMSVEKVKDVIKQKSIEQDLKADKAHEIVKENIKIVK